MPAKQELLPLLFGFQARVSRRSYIIAGLVLMLFKYEVEYLVVRIATGQSLPPLSFLSPLVTQRLPTALPALDVGLLAIFSLPFLWIGVSMSVRRAEEIGLSAWVGALFLVPWRLWTNPILHAIHLRVLEHVKTLSERDP